MISRYVLFGFFITCFASPIAAQTATTDTNGDGHYSLEELQVVDPTMDQSTFDAMDANLDGLLDPEEIVVGEFSGLLPVDR